MRALFEKTISNFNQDQAYSIWKNFIEFENGYSDLSSIQKNEKRFIGTYTQGITRIYLFN